MKTKHHDASRATSNWTHLLRGQSHRWRALERLLSLALSSSLWDPQKHTALVQDSSRYFTQPLLAFPFSLFFQVFHATSSRVPFSSHALQLRQTASFLSDSTKSVRCVLGLLLSCCPTFTLSLPLLFFISYSCYSLSFSLFRIFFPFGSICLSCCLTCLCHQGQATLRGQHRHLS
jgi:hypothetical protein